MSTPKCPHCGNEVQLENYVYHNVFNYRRAVVARTACCGAALVVKPIEAISVQPYTGTNVKDDWAVPFEATNPEGLTTILEQGQKGTPCTQTPPQDTKDSDS